MAHKKIKGKDMARQRSKRRIKKRLESANNRPRLSVFRSSKHIYAQLVTDDTGVTIASACSLDKEVADLLKSAPTAEEEKGSRSTKSMHTAKIVGQLLAKRSMEKNIKSIVFDRNGYVYHGRVRAVAEGAREGGLDF